MTAEWLESTPGEAYLPVTPVEAWGNLVQPTYPPPLCAHPRLGTCKWFYYRGRKYLGGQFIDPTYWILDEVIIEDRPSHLALKVLDEPRIWHYRFQPHSTGTLLTISVEGDPVAGALARHNVASGPMTTDQWHAHFQEQCQRWADAIEESGWLWGRSVPLDITSRIDATLPPDSL